MAAETMTGKVARVVIEAEFVSVPTDEVAELVYLVESVVTA